MSEKPEETPTEQEESKELSVEDLEDVAGGHLIDLDGVEIGETDGGTKDIKID